MPRETRENSDDYEDDVESRETEDSADLEADSSTESGSSGPDGPLNRSVSQASENLMKVEFTVIVTVPSLNNLRVPIPTDTTESPRHLLDKLRVKLASQNMSKRVEGQRYKLLALHTSRWLRMDSASLEDEKVTPTTPEVLYLQTAINIKIVMPDLKVYTFSDLDGSKMCIDLIDQICKMFGIAHSEEWTLIQNFQNKDLALAQSKKSVNTVELSKFELPSPEDVANFGLKYDTKKQSREMVMNAIETNKVNLVLSLIEQGHQDSEVFYLRMASCCISHSSYKLSPVRSNMIVYQAYSDYLNNIYQLPTYFENTFLGSLFVTVKYYSGFNQQANPAAMIDTNLFERALVFLEQFENPDLGLKAPDSIKCSIMEFVGIKTIEKYVKNQNLCTLTIEKKDIRLDFVSEGFNETVKLPINKSTLSIQSRKQKEGKVKAKVPVLVISCNEIRVTLLLTDSEIGKVAFGINYKPLLTQTPIIYHNHEQILQIIKIETDYAINTTVNKPANLELDLNTLTENKYLPYDFLHDSKNGKNIKPDVYRFFLENVNQSTSLDQAVDRVISFLSYTQQFCPASIYSDLHLDNIVSKNSARDFYKNLISTGQTEKSLGNYIRFSIECYPSRVKVIPVYPEVKAKLNPPPPENVYISPHDIVSWNMSPESKIMLNIVPGDNPDFLYMMKCLNIEEEKDKGLYKLSIFINTKCAHGKRSAYNAHEIYTIFSRLIERRNNNSSYRLKVISDLKSGLRSNLRRIEVDTILTATHGKQK